MSERRRVPARGEREDKNPYQDPGKYYQTGDGVWHKEEVHDDHDPGRVYVEIIIAIIVVIIILVAAGDLIILSLFG